MAGPLGAIWQVYTTGNLKKSVVSPIWVRRTYRVFLFCFFRCALIAFFVIQIVLLSALGLVLGLATFGYQVTAAMGTKLAKLTPSRGFAAELATATVSACQAVLDKVALSLRTIHSLSDLRARVADWLMRTSSRSPHRLPERPADLLVAVHHRRHRGRGAVRGRPGLARAGLERVVFRAPSGLVGHLLPDRGADHRRHFLPGGVRALRQLRVRSRDGTCELVWPNRPLNYFFAFSRPSSYLVKQYEGGVGGTASFLLTAYTDALKASGFNTSKTSFPLMADIATTKANSASPELSSGADALI